MTRGEYRKFVSSVLGALSYIHALHHLSGVSSQSQKIERPLSTVVRKGGKNRCQREFWEGKEKANDYILGNKSSRTPSVKGYAHLLKAPPRLSKIRPGEIIMQGLSENYEGAPHDGSCARSY